MPTWHSAIGWYVTSKFVDVLQKNSVQNHGLNLLECPVGNFPGTFIQSVAGRLPRVFMMLLRIQQACEFVIQWDM